MFSKVTLWLLALTLMLSSCTLPTNEDPSLVKVPDNKLGEQTQCLSELLPVMEGFMAGTAAPEQVSGIWACFGNALTLFQKSTRGAFTDRFTAREIANFFERYFLKDTRISDRLLLEIFHLKQIFVGGEPTDITRAELTKLILFSAKMRQISLYLLPYMKVFTIKWKISGFKGVDADVRYFEAANLEIQNAAKDISAIIEANDKSYDIANLPVLLEEVAKLYGEHWTLIDEINRTLPLVYKVKKALAGGDESRIAPDEWRRFALLGARGFVQYLRYHYFIEESEDSGQGAELVYIARSVDDLFSYLGDMVGSKPGGLLTRAELKDILEAITQFFPAIKISDNFLLEVMKIKQVIFGGSVDDFTPQDFERAREKIETFRTLTERFLSYSYVYGLSWDPKLMGYQEAQDYFKLAETNLIEFAQKLGGILEKDYNLMDLITLADEIDKLYPPQPGEKTLLEYAVKYVPLVGALKNTIFTDQGNILTQRQWPDFLDMGSRIYSRYMYVHYFLSSQDLTKGKGLSSLGVMAQQTFDVLDLLIGRKPQQVIPFTEVDVLLARALTAELLPNFASLQTIQGISRIVFEKMLLDPRKRIEEKYKGRGIELATTQFLRSEFSIWFENQRFIDGVYANTPDTLGVPTAQLLKSLDATAATVGIEELKKIIISPVQMTFGMNDKLFFGEQGMDHFRASVNKMNLMRSAVRLVTSTYSESLDRIKSYTGINEAELAGLVADIRPVAEELDLIDPKNTSFAADRFRDANLFNPHSDGNLYASFQELTELFLMIWSGININTGAYSRLESFCEIQSLGKKSSRRVDYVCFVNFYKKDFAKLFDSLPDFLKFTAKISVANFQGMIANLLKASGYIDNPQKILLIGDTALVPHVVQYIEQVMQRFDVNHDGILNTQESMNAFPVFKEILKKARKEIDSDKKARFLFAYLLKKAKVPSTVDFVFWYLFSSEKNWDLAADREILAKILGLIADETRKAESKKGKLLPDLPDPNDIPENLTEDELKAICSDPSSITQWICQEYKNRKRKH